MWYLEHRQPEVLVGTCDHAMVSDVSSGPSSDGRVWYAHPGSSNFTDLPRANYTLHSSTDGGAEWSFENRVYAGGAGYSDAHVVRTGEGDKRALAMVFQKTFDPPVPGVEGGGYDMGFSLFPID